MVNMADSEAPRPADAVESSGNKSGSPITGDSTQIQVGQGPIVGTIDSVDSLRGFNVVPVFDDAVSVFLSPESKSPSAGFLVRGVVDGRPGVFCLSETLSPGRPSGEAVQ
eukprot:8859623-Heterocapsa_arctica.AAC.1